MRGFLIVGAVLLAASAQARGTHYVAPHVTKDGTYVQPHVQTNPNKTKNDNWSTRGNTNPITGQQGTKPRDGETSAPKR